MPDRLVKRRGSQQVNALVSDPRAVFAASDDGVLSFQLSPCEGGILVTRTEVRTRAAKLVQSTRFADEFSFLRWCEADRMKFSYPLLYANLKRSGCGLFIA